MQETDWPTYRLIFPTPDPSNLSLSGQISDPKYRIGASLIVMHCIELKIVSHLLDGLKSAAVVFDR